MKRLFLIRHAKSSWSNPALADFDRGLNKRGKRDAPFMAKRLAERGASPDLIISSPAKRARKTAKQMARGVNYPPKQIVFVESLYSSTIDDLYAALANIEDDIDELFLVGHNYGITEFAEIITGQVVENIPTSGVFCIDCAITSWRALGPGSGKVVFFDYPKNYTLDDDGK